MFRAPARSTHALLAALLLLSACRSEDRASGDHGAPDHQTDVDTDHDVTTDEKDNGNVSPTGETPTVVTGDGDQGDGDQGDGDRGHGDGDEQPDVPDVMAEPGVAKLGASCSLQLQKACSGHNDTNKLICLEGKWTFNGTCDGLSRCDTRTGDTLGTCQGQAVECIDKRPHQAYCIANAVITCGADLLDRKRSECKARSLCTESGLDATCVCETPDDGLGGCAKVVGKYWDNENGTIYDPATKLTWQQGLNEPTDNGLAPYRCNELTLENKRYQGQWRLPTLVELETLRDTSHGSPAIDHDAFPDTPALPFWSSIQEVHGDSTFNWYVDFADTEPHRGEDYISDYNFRCVSGEQQQE